MCFYFLQGVKKLKILPFGSLKNWLTWDPDLLLQIHKSMIGILKPLRNRIILPKVVFIQCHAFHADNHIFCNNTHLKFVPKTTTECEIADHRQHFCKNLLQSLPSNILYHQTSNSVKKTLFWSEIELCQFVDLQIYPGKSIHKGLHSTLCIFFLISLNFALV